MVNKCTNYLLAYTTFALMGVPDNRPVYQEGFESSKRCTKRTNYPEKRRYKKRKRK